MESERPTRRKSAFSGSSDPRTYVAGGHQTYPEQFYAVAWSDCAWRPSRAVVVHRSKLDAETIRWLARYTGK